MVDQVLTDPRTTPAVLLRAGEVVLPALRQALTALHPDLAVMAGYHCGLSDRHGLPVPARSGKMLRPALVLLASRTVTASVTSPPAEVVAGAVVVQLVHEFSLLHDDIMDRDRTRRGRPAAWAVYGAGKALLVGDAVLALAVSLLAEHIEAEAVLAEALVRLCTGQADDLFSLTSATVTVADWERMAGGKTGALIAASCRIGAVLAGADRETVAVLGAAGTQLGLAFQAIDDWLGIWGDPRTTGKPVGADIAARKRSLPVVAGLANPAGRSTRRLAALLTSARELTADDILSVTTLLEQMHADEYTRGYARQHATVALDTLATLTIPREVWWDWADLIAFLTARVS